MPKLTSRSAPCAMSRAMPSRVALASPPAATVSASAPKIRASLAMPVMTPRGMLLDAVQHVLAVALLQVAVPRQGPERKERTVAVVAQIKHPREADSGVFVL